MRAAWLLVAALLGLSAAPAGQAQAVLHVSVTLPDEGGVRTPVPGYILLVSDNPATVEPRRLRTAADGTATLRLRPGSYTVESDRPVALLGRGYQWTEILDLAAGTEVTLALTEDNAEVVEITDRATAAAAPGAPGGVDARSDPLFLPGKWGRSLVAVWSPTARATGSLVDARGLIVTDGVAVAAASMVEVQLSATEKVPGRVLVSEPSRGLAVVWTDPGVVAGRSPLPLTCPPGKAAALEVGREVLALSLPLRTGTDLVTGEVTGHRPRAIDADLRLAFGGAGGPVFDEAGTLVGVTSLLAEGDAATRRDDVAVVRLATVCEMLAAAATQMAKAAAPPATRLPVEPLPAPAPAAATRTGTAPAAAPPAATTTPPGGAAPTGPITAASNTFDVAFLTAPMLRQAQARAGRTGGTPTRGQEVQARLGPITEFDAWTEYFADAPNVVIVRVTPKMVEGFWKRLGREALRTQGAVLPAFKDFTGSFVRLRAACGGEEVTPIHPFVLEHTIPGRETEKAVREGLYVFAPDAFDGCRDMTLALFSEKDPEKADTLVVTPALLQRLTAAR